MNENRTVNITEVIISDLVWDKLPELNLSADELEYRVFQTLQEVRARDFDEFFTTDDLYLYVINIAGKKLTIERISVLAELNRKGPSPIRRRPKTNLIILEEKRLARGETDCCILDLGLSVRSWHTLQSININYLSELRTKSVEELKSLEGMSSRSLEEIIIRLEEIGIKLMTRENY